MSDKTRVGDTHEFSRVYTVDEIRRFSQLSGDFGKHHVEPNEDGEVVVHGLLTVSVSTAIGSRIHFLAREMNWMYVRPIYTGDTIRAVVKVARIEPGEERSFVQLNIRIYNGSGKVAARGESRGAVANEHLDLSSIEVT